MESNSRKFELISDFKEKFTSPEGNPFAEAGILSRLFFSWLLPLLAIGQKVPLEQDMNYPLREGDRIESNQFTFQEAIKINIENGKMHNLIFRSLVRIHRCEIFQCVLGAILYGILTYISPFIVFLGTQLAQRAELTLNNIVWLVFWYTILKLASCVCLTQTKFMFTILLAKMKQSVTLAIFSKCLQMHSASSFAGELTNLIQVDCGKFDEIAVSAFEFFKAPMLVLIGLGYLFFVIGLANIAGLLVIVVIGLFGAFLSKFQFKNERLLMSAKDKRTKATSEAFSNIRLVKLHPFENFITEKLCSLRKVELKLLTKLYWIGNAIMLGTWLMSPLNAGSVIGFYGLLNGVMDPIHLITFYAASNEFVFALFAFPSALMSQIDFLVSLRRIDQFLLREEAILDHIRRRKSEDLLKEKLRSRSFSSKGSENEANAIQIKNGCFFWEKSEFLLNPSKNPTETEKETKSKEPLMEKLSPVQQGELEMSQVSRNDLEEINMVFPKGQVIGIVGEIASGKSSVFSAILGEMKAQSPSKVWIDGKIAYMSQNPWIQGTTVKENILFGEKYSLERYERAVRGSLLNEDLKFYPERDMTVIGDKGITLSGGQKARLALARCLYANADIYLLDDPLSAVDVKVGKSIMKDTILQQLKGKTVVLITHAVHYLQHCDYIYLMRGGRVQSEGTYSSLSKEEYFQRFISMVKKRSKEKEEVPDDYELRRNEENQRTSLLNRPSIQSPIPQERNRIMSDLLKEDRQYGEVSFRDYLSYCKLAGGAPFLFFLFGFFLLNLFLMIFYIRQLTKWMDTESPEEYWSYFTVVTASGCVRAFSVYCAYQIASRQNLIVTKKLHVLMVRKLTHASLTSFWDRVPLGIVLNRLTRDIDTIDKTFVKAYLPLICSIWFIIVDILIPSLSSSFFIIVLVLIYGFLAVSIQKYYIKVFRESTRLESISRSPIITLFHEALHGLMAIRAFSKENYFKGVFVSGIETHYQNIIVKSGLQNWYTTWLLVLSLVVQTPVILLVLLYGRFDSQHVGDVGIGLYIIIYLEKDFVGLLNSWSDLQTKMVSVERCLRLAEIPIEPGYLNYEKETQLTLQEEKTSEIGKKEAEEFKSKMVGSVKYSKVFASYQEGLPSVLSGITAEIQPGEKIGILGRTVAVFYYEGTSESFKMTPGAGKTSFVSALYRGLELTSGSISIDGVNIEEIDLKVLRASITVIPQDSYLFNESLADNIDPDKTISKAQLEQVLQETGVLDHFASRGGMDFMIEPNGKNLSVGEKQLVQFARAIVKNNKIIILDEPTSSIDPLTERVVQNIIQTKLMGCTILVIAHRVHTLQQCDKVLVLDKGAIKEFHRPEVLLRNSSSLYKSILDEVMKEERI